MIILPEGFKFRLNELLDPHTFKSRTEEVGWELFEQKALDMLHGIRSFLGDPITINDWFTGGQYEWSGYRSAGCTIGAPGSEHRKGRAFDLKVKGLTAANVQWMLMESQDDPLLKDLNRIELATPTWTHVDCKMLNDHQNRIYLFRG